MALICVPLVGDRVDADVELANKTDCDLAEVRLDYLRDTSDIAKLRSVNKPLIATCMPKWECGRFEGGEEERVRLLESCLDYCKYITVELKTERKLRDQLIAKAKKKGVKVIVAHHSFKATPPLKEILRIMGEEAKAGADIAKVSYMPNSKKDVLTLMQALVECNLKIPAIAISMGELGKISRVIAPALGAYLTFGSVSRGMESAPGQLTVDELKAVKGMLW